MKRTITLRRPPVTLTEMREHAAAALRTNEQAEAAIQRAEQALAEARGLLHLVGYGIQCTEDTAADVIEQRNTLAVAKAGT